MKMTAEIPDSFPFIPIRKTRGGDSIIINLDDEQFYRITPTGQAVKLRQADPFTARYWRAQEPEGTAQIIDGHWIY